jgi:hypothetical protein
MPAKTHVAERAIDRIPRVDDAVSVGEDLDFQRTWWQFEQIAWVVLALVLIADGLGVLGRGWLARAERQTADGRLDVKYERVERTGTPSEMTIRFGAGAMQGGRIQLFSSESVVKALGAQRIIPEPAASQIGPGGITYTFAATGTPAVVSFSLEPSFPGIHEIELRIPGSEPVRARIVVLP